MKATVSPALCCGNHDPAARLFQRVQRYTDGLHGRSRTLVGSRPLAEWTAFEPACPAHDETPWPSLRDQLITLAAETASIPYATYREAATPGTDLQTAGDMAAVLIAAPIAPPTHPVRCLGSRALRQTLQAPSVWGPYLAKRSKLVADLAEQVQDTPASDAGRSGLQRKQTSTELYGEIAVWRAPTALSSPSDPTEEPNSKTLPALWKQHPTGLSRVPQTRQQMPATSDRAGGSALSRSDDSHRPYQKTRNRVREARPAPPIAHRHSRSN